jgi:hypothetical protein
MHAMTPITSRPLFESTSTRPGAEAKPVARGSELASRRARRLCDGHQLISSLPWIFE